MAEPKTNFFRRLNDFRKYAKDEGERELYQSLTDVERYVKTGAFSQTDPATYRIFYENRLATVKEGAGALDVAPNTFNQRRGYFSRKLYDLFGQDFFMLPYEADGADQIRARLANAGDSRTASKVVLRELITEHRGKSLREEFTLKDCESEIRLLTRYSRTFLNDTLDGLDPRKIAYLISLLDGGARNVSDRSLLFSMLESGRVGQITAQLSATSEGTQNG